MCLHTQARSCNDTNEASVSHTDRDPFLTLLGKSEMLGKEEIYFF